MQAYHTSLFLCNAYISVCSSPVCSSLFLLASCSSLNRSSSLMGSPASSLGIMRPWNGHCRKTKIKVTLLLQKDNLFVCCFVCPVTLRRSCLWHRSPLSSRARQKWLTGVKLPGKDIYLLLLCAKSSLFCTSSSIGAWAQNWCWEGNLHKATRELTTSITEPWWILTYTVHCICIYSWNQKFTYTM